MPKLAILDKDGTLVRPKSGHTFVRHPEDQELLPGVEDAIARLVADGYTLAIASNQGGVAVRECLPLDFPVGAYYVEKSDPSNYPVRVIRKLDTRKGITLYTATPRQNGKDYLWFEHYSQVHFQYKTLEDAIAEMNYCLKLLSKYEFASVLFCPDDGQTCRNQYGVSYSYNGSSYRKPEPGMLELAKFQAETGFLDPIGFISHSDCLMVGDRPEDEQAAIAAGIPFVLAREWRGDRHA